MTEEPLAGCSSTGELGDPAVESFCAGRRVVCVEQCRPLAVRHFQCPSERSRAGAECECMDGSTPLPEGP